MENKPELEKFLEKENKKAWKKLIFWMLISTVISGSIIIGMFYIIQQATRLF